MFSKFLAKVSKIFSNDAARNIYLLLVGFMTLVSLYYFSIGSYFTRYFADDFCTASLLHSAGFWGAQKTLYNTWSGRITSAFSIYSMESLGQIAARVTPFIVVTLIIAALYLNIKYFIKDDLLSRVSAIIVSSFFVVFTFFNSPNTIQVLFWQTGSLTYTIPFGFFLLYTALLLKLGRMQKINKYQQLVALIASFVLTFFAGAFSESYSALQTVWVLLIAGVFLYCSSKQAKKISTYLSSGLLGSLASLGVMTLAPGNIIRKEALPPTLSIIKIIYYTLTSSWDYLVKTVLSGRFIIISAAVFLIFYILFSLNSRFEEVISLKKYLIYTLASLGGASLLVLSVVGPAWYGLGWFPPNRTLYLIHFSLLTMVAVIAFLTSRFMKYRAAVIYASTAILVVLWFVITPRLITYYGTLVGQMEKYANVWDEQDRILSRSGGDGAVIVPAQGSIGEFEVITGDPKNWVNSCTARYYGVKSIESK